MAALPTLPPGVPAGETITLSSIVKFVDQTVSVLAIIASVIIVGFIIYGGLMMATAAGDENRFKKGKSVVYSAIIGGLIVFGVGIIVRTIADFAASPTRILR